MPDEKSPADTKTDEDAVPTTPDVSDDLVTTRHRVKAGRRTLRYTATSGRVVLRHEKVDDGEFKGHQPQAEVFVTAYTLDSGTGSDDADARPDPQRPVTFCFNGGPGSSSVWLHLGLLGPRRVLMGDAGELLPPPYGLADNAETLLAHSDLVFIDPVSTGYSRAVEGGKPKEFHGYTADIESVGEVIRLWTTRNGRWMSPKFLAGESYGTLRAAALAEHLQSRYGMYLNGIMLISMVLDMGTIRFTEGNDLPYALFLPTYAAIAHHHGLHGDRTLADVLAEAEEYAARDYPWVLSRGARLTPSQRAAAVRKIAGLTGLPREYVDRADLRIEHLRFFTELLRGQGRTVGRLDGRFAGWDKDRVSRARWTATRRTRPSTGPTAPRSTTTCARTSGTRATCPTRSSPTRCGRGRTRSSRTARSPWSRSSRPRCAPTRTCGCTWPAATTTGPRRTRPPSTPSPTCTSRTTCRRTSRSATTRPAT